MDFRLRPEDLAFIGTGLHRPECALSFPDGRIAAPDWRGGVSIVEPDGRTRFVLGRGPRGRPLRPNGIAAAPDGGFYLADLGDEAGGLLHLAPDGAVRTVLAEIEGVPLPPSNFPLVDREGRIWLTVSTRLAPRARGYRGDWADGFIVLLPDPSEPRSARIVADGLGYANECALSADGRALYVNETFGRRLSRFEVAANGDLSAPATVTEFGYGSFPDGLALDAEGGLWVTSIVSNRVIHVAADGRQTVALEDCDPDWLAEVEAAYEARMMTPRHLTDCGGRILRNVSNLAFGGPDLRTCYLGCLSGAQIACFRSPVIGRAPAHWA